MSAPKTFRAVMTVTHREIWEVEAESETEARQKLNDLSDDVETDDTGGDVADWEIVALSDVEDG